jgi:hypothetical protein
MTERIATLLEGSVDGSQVWNLLLVVPPTQATPVPASMTSEHVETMERTSKSRGGSGTNFPAKGN